MLSTQAASHGSWFQRRENIHEIVDLQISADGSHVWAFNPTFPMEVRSFTFRRKRNICLTRDNYFELLYVHPGEATSFCS